MSIENSFSNNQENLEVNTNNVIEKADMLIREIVLVIKENPLYEENAEKNALTLEEKWDLLRASAKNERINNHINELIENNIAEEVFKTDEVDPSDPDFYVLMAQSGFRLVNKPIYGSKEDEIIGHRYLKTPMRPNAEQVHIANEIYVKYEEESHKSFANSWRIKEELFEEKIKTGEMVFLGEMLFDDYIKLRIDNAPESHQIKYELTPVFDENQITWSEDTERVYAYK